LASVTLNGFQIIWSAVGGLIKRRERLNVDELVALAIIASLLEGEFLTAAMMKANLRLILRKIVSALRERWHLCLDNIALRHQIAVLERSGNRPQFTNGDRLFWVTLSTLWPRWPEALEIMQAETVKRWRQRGFWHYVLGKGRRRRPGRPAIEPEIRSLIQRMSRKNLLWGAVLSVKR